MKELFTKSEIEKFGFIYEPDVTKCKVARTRPHYKCNYYEDGKFIDTTEPILTEDWKNRAVEIIKMKGPQYKYINSIFVLDVSPLSGKGVLCQFVMIRGHA